MLPAGIVFDMDGTLTVPCIDFGEMYREVSGCRPARWFKLCGRAPAGHPPCAPPPAQVGVSRGQDILAVIAEWSEAEQQRAFGIIAAYEQKALEDMQASERRTAAAGQGGRWTWWGAHVELHPLRRPPCS